MNIINLSYPVLRALILKINTQFVSSTNQNLFCYLTVSEVITNQSGDPELLKIYLPELVG